MKAVFLPSLALLLALAGVAEAQGLLGPGWRPQIRWQDLSPETQEKARQNFNAYQSLSPEEKGKLDARYQRWKSMSAEDKQRLRERYHERSKKRR